MNFWNRFRWQLSLALSALTYKVMPEPQRSRVHKHFAAAAAEIKAREELGHARDSG